MPITDDSPMPFGTYKGRALINVPHKYLIKKYNNNSIPRQFSKIEPWIENNLGVVKRVRIVKEKKLRHIVVKNNPAIDGYVFERIVKRRGFFFMDVSTFEELDTLRQSKEMPALKDYLAYNNIKVTYMQDQKIKLTANVNKEVYHTVMS